MSTTAKLRAEKARTKNGPVRCVPPPASGSEFPFSTAWRRRWFTIPQITDFIRAEIAVDLGNGCPISRRERERNKILEYIASRLEAVTTKSDEDIPF